MGNGKTNFQSKYVVSTDTGCWDWIAGKFPNGYGAYLTKYAHRFAYELHVGRIAPNMVVDHLCRNRGCVNPKHMEIVTRGENVLRGDAPTAINKRKTHCKHGHEFTFENTYNRQRPGRSPERDCLTCRRSYGKGEN